MENNKLIATFMGLLRSDEPVGGLGHEKYHWFYKRPFLWDESICSDDELRYDTSWDWLMPVVEKIESIKICNKGGAAVIINGTLCQINGISHIESTKIKAVYSAVIHFIKWYNAKKE